MSKGANLSSFNGWRNSVTSKLLEGKSLEDQYEMYKRAGGTEVINFDSPNIDGLINPNNSTSNNSINVQDFYNMLGQYDQSIRNNLMLSPTDQNTLAYKSNMYGALDQYQATADASLAATEMSAYAMLGQQQLELESTIAEQRMKALKSGTTSAQLASQQLANMFAAQSGAAQIANNMMQSRMSNANQFAQSRYGITQDMYSMINANQQTYANAQAQLGAIAGSYASTINQPYAQFDAWLKLTPDERKQLQTTYAG